MKHVTKAAAGAGKAAGMLVREVADVKMRRELGFTWIAIDSDLAILRNAYRKLVMDFKGE